MTRLWIENYQIPWVSSHLFGLEVVVYILFSLSIINNSDENLKCLNLNYYLTMYVKSKLDSNAKRNLTEMVVVVVW